MRYYIAIAVALLAAPLQASDETRGIFGIDAVGLKMPNNMTNLTGFGVPIGQVEPGRPPKTGLDGAAVLNNQLFPAEVYLRAVPITSADQNLTHHAAWTAGVMNASSFGVAPGATLFSSAYETTFIDPGYQHALQAIQRIATRPDAAGTRAINNSWGKDVPGLQGPDGNTLLTLGVDWLASKHDALIVFSGYQDEGVVPQDNYNGITVAASAKNGFFYNTVASFNSTDEDASGDRTSVDILAPGDSVMVTGLGNVASTQDGTSFAAPHVTGTVALLQQYGDFQNTNVGGIHWGSDNHRTHEVMKALLLAL